MEQLTEQPPQSQPVVSEASVEVVGVFSQKTSINELFDKQFEKTKGRWYLYALIRPDKNGEFFYIGKGKNKRIFEHFRKSHKNVNNHKWNIIQKLLNSGYHRKELLKILMVCGDEKYLIESEVSLIKKIGRANLNEGPLTNLTNGGEGMGGRVVSEETRKKLSLSHVGQKAWNKGIPRTEELKKRLSELAKGKKPSLETRKKMSESRKGLMAREKSPMWGKHPSEESRKKMSDSHMGEKNPFYGKTHSEEVLKIISKTHKGKKTKKRIPIVAYNKDGEILYFPLINQAIKEGFASCGYYLKNPLKIYKGYYFRKATAEEIAVYGKCSDLRTVSL